MVDFLEQIQCLTENKLDLNDLTFYVYVGSINLRNRSGSIVFIAYSAENFVCGVIGLDCDFTAKFIESDECTLRARVSHHDSPRGETRTVLTLREWIGKQVGDYQKLQILLTKLRQTEYLFRGNWIGARWEWWDEDMVGKPLRQYTRKIFTSRHPHYYLLI